MILELSNLARWQAAAIFNRWQFFYLCGGLATGKSYTGAHFVIYHLLKYPDLTGFVGANSFDQLSQATLRELMHWLNEYGFEFVIDRMPPPHWGSRRDFKTYQNILTVFNKWTRKVTHIFTRTLSEGDPLRGVEFSWFFLDETRDTEEYVFDIILGRMRESNYSKGLIGSTPNGEDWTYRRFVKGDRSLYGSLHIETYESVKAGIITEAYYNSLLKSYSPQLAAQELFAKHVNIGSGRAYYAAGPQNRLAIAPWGATHPDPAEPLIVGVDFNFSPSPLVWVVGQLGYVNNELCIHWFGELSEKEMSTEDMTIRLMNQYPGFFYRIFGDASGTRGSTSNQGQTDYIQMQNVLNNAGCTFSIDVDQSNPRVKDRVENMNRLFKNALGEIRQTYDPNRCPLLEQDIRMVGWKRSSSFQNRSGKLDDGGDVNLTHASDAAGYAAYKLLPPAGQIIMSSGNVRSIHAELI